MPNFPTEVFLTHAILQAMFFYQINHFHLLNRCPEFLGVFLLHFQSWWWYTNPQATLNSELTLGIKMLKYLLTIVQYSGVRTIRVDITTLFKQLTLEKSLPLHMRILYLRILFLGVPSSCDLWLTGGGVQISTGPHFRGGGWFGYSMENSDILQQMAIFMEITHIRSGKIPLITL